MSSPIALDSSVHRHLRIDSRPGPNYGDSVNRTQVFATEFGEVHKEFPILFHKDADTGEYQAHAILGLAKDENLFLGDKKWLCRYVPAMLARGPFLMGSPDPASGAADGVDPVILVDRDDPRVGVEDGQPVFLKDGGHSPYLESVLLSLRIIHQGVMVDKEFFSCLDAMNLLEPVSIKATLSNIEQVELHSYFTINQDNLMQLDGKDLKQLNSKGILPLVFFALSSLGNVNKLIEIKNRRAALA